MRKAHLLMSLVLIAITTLASIATVAKVPKTQAATAVFSVSKVVVKEAGKTFLVNISVTGVTDLYLWVLNMSWDPNIVKITTGDTQGLRRGGIYYNIYEGPFLKSMRPTDFSATQIDNAKGKIKQLFSGFKTVGTSANGDGILATINFTSVNVGTTILNIDGPSIAYPGRCMLLDSAGQEMPHEDIDGAVLETEPPPPPIWTEFWFQASIVAAVAVGVVIGAGAYTFKRRKARGPGPTEEEELKGLLESDAR